MYLQGCHLLHLLLLPFGEGDCDWCPTPCQMFTTDLLLTTFVDYS